MTTNDELATRLFEVACETNLEAALGRVLDLLIQEAGAERGFLVTPEADGLEVRVARRIERAEVAGPAMQPSRTLIRRAIDANAPVRVGRAQESVELSMAPSVAGSQVESLLAVPILAGERLRAVACLDSTRRDAFSPEVEARVARLCAPLGQALTGASRVGRLERQQSELSRRLGDERGPALLGDDAVWRASLELVRRVAPTHTPILIRGETGTGKEQVARALHAWSARADGPFVAIDCGALPEDLLEAELFGHEAGAFTGALRPRPGLFATAHGGTLFLDGVDELSERAQGRFLRVLESGEIQRLGSDRGVAVDVRIAASLRPGREEQVRSDLRYRLAVMVVDLPPLRERGRDVLTLAEAFLLETALRHDRELEALSAEVADVFLAYPWPGNVRELRNAIERGVLMGQGTQLTLADLPESMDARAPTEWARALRAPRDYAELELARRAATLQVERAYARHVLAAARGNVSEAARQSGQSRPALYELLGRTGVDPRRVRAEADRPPPS